MPRFHFNLADHRREPDLEGTECESVQAARIQAVIFAGAYLRDHPGLVWDGRRFSVEVTDEAGSPVFDVTIEASAD
jgi:hypothetical protein